MIISGGFSSQLRNVCLMYYMHAVSAKCHAVHGGIKSETAFTRYLKIYVFYFYIYTGFRLITCTVSRTPELFLSSPQTLVIRTALPTRLTVSLYWVPVSELTSKAV